MVKKKVTKKKRRGKSKSVKETAKKKITKTSKNKAKKVPKKKVHKVSKRKKKLVKKKEIVVKNSGKNNYAKVVKKVRKGIVKNPKKKRVARKEVKRTESKKVVKKTKGTDERVKKKEGVQKVETSKVESVKDSKLKVKKKKEVPMPPAEYKRITTDKKPEIKISSEERKKLRMTEAKIKKMLDVAHLEELFHILNLLNDKQISLFIQHYKNSEIEKTSDQKLDLLIKNSENYNDLLEALKKELVAKLSDELIDVKATISDVLKGGVDAYVETVKAMSIPLKIRIFEATGSKDDYYKVKKILHSLEESLEPKKVEAKRIEEERVAREDAFEKSEKERVEKRQQRIEEEVYGKKETNKVVKNTNNKTESTEKPLPSKT